jgi:hypothetical protein
VKIVAESTKHNGLPNAGRHAKSRLIEQRGVETRRGLEVVDRTDHAIPVKQGSGILALEHPGGLPHNPLVPAAKGVQRGTG